jgi:RNA polymerase sigma-70 factor (ECF subfamily)
LEQAERDAVGVLKRGDIQGLEALVRLHQLRAIRTAYAITGDRHAAEDVVADAFLTVYDRIEQFDERRPFTPWFYRIVVNAAIKAARQVSRVPFLDEDGEEILSQQLDPSLGPEDRAVLRELRFLMVAAIYTLPPGQRAAVVLRYYLDMDEATIAETLRCPLGTVKWRLHAARKRLRGKLVMPEMREIALGYED